MATPPPADLIGPLFDAHPDPALVVAADGTVRAANAAARRAWDTGGEAPRGLADLGLAPSDLALAAAGPLERRLGTPPRRHRLRAGAEFQGLRVLTAVPVDDTEAADERVQHLQEQLQLAQAFGRLGVFRRDIRTMSGEWDPNAWRIWGLREQAQSPDYATLTERVLPQDREAFARAMPESMKAPGSYGHRFRILGPDGSVRHLSTQWVVRADAQGRPERTIGVVIDETEAWELARARDETQRRLGAAVEMGQIAIWERDLATDDVRCNAVARRLLGLEGPGPTWRPERLLSRIHPDDLRAYLEAGQRGLEQDEPVECECRIRHDSGRWLLLHTRRVIERDDSGRAVAVVGVGLDITRRREDARRARELLRRFNLAARTAGIAHWSLEHGAERSRWSEQMYAMYGLPARSPVPTMREWLATFVHREDRARVHRSYVDWLRSGRPSHEMSLRVVRTDGRVLHLLAHSRQERQGERRLTYGVVIDVTQRQATEAALHAAAERARLIAQGVGLGTWDYDLLTGEAIWDEQMFRLRGIAPGERALTPQERQALVHPDDRERVASIFTEQIRQQPGPIEYEFRVVWPDGSVHWLASRSTAVCDADGRPLRRIGVNWDITEARNAVAEREERLAAQREVRAKTQFLARMSHELRTPLNAVLGFTQLMLDDAEDEATLRRRRLHHVRAAGQHLLSLIDDVLDLSQLEGGEVSIRLQPVPLAPLVAELLPLLEPQAAGAGVSIAAGALDVQPLADPTRLRQVLLNLLSNAVKYNHRGGHVHLEAEALHGIVALRVRDTGPGMSAEQMRHLFEPFNRLGAEKRGVEGTGIGLAIVKALVERMDGTIHVESAPSRGTCFELRLRDGHGTPPDGGERATPQALALALSAGRVGRGGTVLYIEDNAVNTLIVGELLAQRRDLRLLTAETGHEGLARARDERPDLVLLDMQLPDIDGFEVFERLRADPATAAIPCIALSANAMPEDIERARRAGFADYWTKPLDFGAFDVAMQALFGPPPA